MPPSHIDNLLDFVSTFGKECLTQSTGLAQWDKSNGNLTEGCLGGKKNKRKVLLLWSEDQAEQRGTDVSAMRKEVALGPPP